MPVEQRPPEFARQDRTSSAANPVPTDPPQGATAAMPHTYARLYYHFVWATWNREPHLSGPIERHAYALIRQECADLRAEVHALGGIEDHVHLLVTVPRTLPLDTFVEKVKGCSSRGINASHEIPTWAFKWQGGYGVITVSPGDRQRIASYVLHQREHHTKGTLNPNAERCYEED